MKRAAAALLALALAASLCGCGIGEKLYKLERDKNGVFTFELQKGELRFYEDDLAKVSIKDISETSVSGSGKELRFTFTVTPKTDALISCSDFSYEIVMADDYAKKQDCLKHSEEKLSDPTKDQKDFTFEVKGIELAKDTKDLSWLSNLKFSFKLGSREMGELKEKDGMMVAEYEDKELAEASVSVGVQPEGAFKGIEGIMIAEEYLRTETLDESLGFTHTGITGFFTDFFNMIRKRNPGSN